MTGLPAREALTAKAARHIDRERLRDLVCDLVDMPSPTGDERPLAEHIASTLRETGIDGQVQLIDSRQANAYGRLPGSGAGPDLMLYAPIDTFSTGDPDQDVPGIGPVWLPYMESRAEVHGDLVAGLGASNPKGHVACVIAAAEAVASSGIPLTGDLVVAFGAGGMPTNADTGADRRNVGQGVGCSYLLEQGVWADFAVIAKPGWSVAWEEVGLAWFEVTVRGTHTYVGARHRLPYRNAIADAGRVVAWLESWFERYAEAHTDGLVAPQGVVSSIDGGWARMAAATAGSCTFRIDLRLSPRTTPMQAKREFSQAIEQIRATDPDIALDWRMTLAIPGATTDPDNWITRSTIAAWERVTGEQHQPALGTSGATDANILRNRGIPTARVGMPKVTEAPFPIDFTAGMNTVDLREMERLTRLLVEVAVDTLTRTRVEVGLSDD
ncbi:M20 family metallopeptidase [Actinocrispum wychmicini]|uniref:Acetylornithine deacetylase/succinyl-diaminopimelate desuccinylase-like protein n=1 Tax=Actinocrispum wychmicini TaxID=1213861 RepID=A0A4R2JM38_9PSEU|nr:M20/M25/M40 family metallo-hydrolase [Actinocrispum wychmicini]TCO61131.1 acetylornithine deacetylase/succinyl-diaminopimelate desuccinylase-like protein [Actinocrispum wychmicini]